jgi:hypothetical protein
VILTGHKGPVTHVAISPDSTLAVTASTDKSLKIWELEANASIEALRYLVHRLAPTPILLVGTYRPAQAGPGHPLLRWIKNLRDHPRVGEIRQTGMILAIEMARNGPGREPYPWQERRGLAVYRHALSLGVLLRPLGNVVYFMPPYVVDEEGIALMARAAVEGIERATREA